MLSLLSVGTKSIVEFLEKFPGKSMEKYLDVLLGVNRRRNFRRDPREIPG